MNKFTDHINQLPPPVKVGADITTWGTVFTGWLGVFQPWLTALATILAITWTSIQIYSWYKKKKNG